ncbi:MAG: hypothetical protein ACK4GJ_04560 [bacterium]
MEIYTQQYWIKSPKAIVDKQQKKIIIPQETFIKNLETLDEFISQKVEIEYDESGKITQITGEQGSGYTTNIPSDQLQLKDKLFFSYSNIHLFSNKYILNNIQFSTCNLCDYHDFTCKHYILSADQAEIIPEDKMILTKSRLFLYKKQILSYNKLVIPLKKKKLPSFKEDTSVFPQIGYNNTDGFFASKNFDYYISNENYGKILTKYGELTGIYYGINNYYRKKIGNLNILLTTYLFLNNNKRYGRSFRNINNNLNFSFKNTNAFVRYNSNRSIFRNFTSPLNESLSYGFNTYLKGINVNYNSTTTSTENFFSSTNKFLRISGNYNNLNFNFSVNDLENNYFITNNTQTSQNTKFDMNYTFSKGLYTLSLLVDNTTNNFGFFGVNKLPELTLKLNRPIRYRERISLSPALFLGKYEEPRFNRKTTKYQFLLNYNIQHIKDKEFNWTTTGIFKQNFYDTGKYYFDRNFHASYVHSLNSNISLNRRNLKLNANYVYNFGKGFAPIFADFTGKYQNLSASLTLLDNKTFQLNLSSNYNLNRGIISPISVNLRYFPNQRFYLSLFTSYDPRRNNFSNVNTNLDWLITKDLRLTTWFNYNTFNKKIDYIDLILIKDNHCWASYIVYKSQLKQIYFYAYLKALPIIGINIGIDQSKKFTPQIPLYP